MTTTAGKEWFLATILAGVLYFLVGYGFAAFARWSTFGWAAITWNRLAFLFSAMVFVTHTGYEFFRILNSTWRTAWHVASAVALGAFGLALAANIHDLSSPGGYRAKLALALVAWPLITAAPAFVVALVVAAGLRIMKRD